MKRRETIGWWVGLALALLCLSGFWRPVAAQSEDPPPNQTIPPPNLYLPLAMEEPPVVEQPPPPRHYASVPIEGRPVDRPPVSHPDLNLAIRGWSAATDGFLGLVNYGGDTDPLAPQIDGMFAPHRLPAFTANYRVHDWDWGCNQPAGCLGGPIGHYPVTLVAMATTPGELLSIPRRLPRIYPGDFKALVLYAEETRITFTYTRRDTAAVGYLIHVEDVHVDPGLLALYRQLDAAGRRSLPALRNDEPFGTATGASIKIATRDTGQFLDPRTCKDWWMDYFGECRTTR